MAKKTKKKTAAARGPTALSKSRGTGLEEYYADPPMKPEEALEEREEIYGHHIPFEERIQSCIQRFRARRRLQGKATRWFTEYLFLGGIDTNKGAFTGADTKELKHMTPAESREATASDTVVSSQGGRFYDGDPNHWIVDFAGVAAGYLSVCIPDVIEVDSEDMNMAIGVVENFLRYVLHHDACPEYDNDVKAALQVCATAREEWPLIAQLKKALPGQFNLAAMKLFSKVQPDEWVERCFLAPDGKGDIRDLDAEVVFYSTLAMTADPKTLQRLGGSPPNMIRMLRETVEIVSIGCASEDLVQRMQSLALDGHHANMVPVGKATVKPAAIEDGWVYRKYSTAGSSELTLYLDDCILGLLRPGMKMELALGELDIGIYFIQALSNIVPSFHTFLAQELMRQYKPPQISDRAAPSVKRPEDAAV